LKTQEVVINEKQERQVNWWWNNCKGFDDKRDQDVKSLQENIEGVLNNERNVNLKKFKF
jgi:hypothetical protein